MVFLLIATTTLTAQRNNLIQEIGIFVGPSALYSDFGERNNFETNSNNVGFGIGIFHIFNFVDSDKRPFISEHFRVRTELSYHRTNLKFYGRYVEDSKTSLFANQLRATTGKNTIIEFGPQLEYYFLNIRNYMYGVNDLAPYVSLGIHYVSFNPEITSDIDPPLDTNPKYLGSIQQKAGFTASVLGGVGVRYSIDQKSDIFLASRWTYYLSDWVDGLNPTEENNGGRPVPENRANDWTYSLNVGYIYYIN